MRKLFVLVVLAGCDKVAGPAELPFQTLGGFDYKERMKLPGDVTEWSGRRVRATGFINPTSQARDLTTFWLVKDRGSCCPFGKRPQINHYIEVRLKTGRKADYSTDPVTVEGVLTVEDRWDGDWQLGLYWMEDGEVVK